MVAKAELTQIEKDKLTIDPNFNFRDIAKRPFHDLTTNEIGMFKWSGIYHQLQKGYFMMRIRIPGGHLTAEQFKRVGELAKAYAQNELCITTRQTLQFHWLRKEDLYKVVESLETVGINTTNCCGDVVRNVTTCHLQGVCQYEVGDARKIIKQIDQDSEFLEKQRNLSRKHKVTVSGCGAACGMQLMNCQAWVPVKSAGENGTQTVGWEYYAGGGLGQSPYLAKRIFSLVPEDLVLEVTRAAVEAHRRYGDRRQRKLGRLKIVVDRLGQQGFALALLNIMRERNIEGLEHIKIAEDPTPDIKPMPYEGEAVIKQRQTGLNVVRVMIRRSEISGQEAIRFAAWATQYGSGDILLTVRQNLQIRGVSDKQVKPLLTALGQAGYRVQGLDNLPDVVACVGTTLCNLAVSDTPNAYKHIVDAFTANSEFWAEVGPFRINMNGCPNSCAHHWIADVGLRGRRTMEQVGSEEGFSLYVGGSLEGRGYLAEFLIDVSADEIVPTLSKLLTIYLKQRLSGAERFSAFSRRIGVKILNEMLAKEFGVQPELPTNMQNLGLTQTFKQVLKESSS